MFCTKRLYGVWIKEKIFVQNFARIYLLATKII